MSSKTTVVQKDGVLYTITNNDHNIEDFNDRMEFIFRTSCSSKDEFDNRVKLSNCYMNTKKLRVVYPENIQSMFS
jgi:hypothetical protein